MTKKRGKPALLVGLVLALAAGWAWPVHAEMRRVVMKIYGMDCAPCAHSMEEGLKKIKGVTKVAVSLNKGTATLDLAAGNKVSLEEIRQVVLKGGFTPEGARIAPAPAANQEAQAHMKTVFIPIRGMVCVKCAARIEKALSSMDGVGKSRVSLAERAARVEFDPSRVSAARIVEVINGLGYHAGKPAAE
ncbi:MAG TPA: copper ion binding protein [Elusimicrobiota bacterium]|nr:copper ion binding protein [Elusimicrobiota bacterium]